MSASNISPFSYQSVDNAPVNSTNSPLTVGANLILTQTGLGAPITFSVAPPQSGSTGTIPELTSVSTFTNKTVDAGMNSLLQLYQSPLLMRTGGFEPHAGASGGFLDGALNGHVLTGTVSYGFDNTSGLFSTFTTGTTAGNNAGLVSPTGSGGLARRAFYTAARSVASVSATTTIRRLFGFSNNSAWPPSNTDTFLASGDSGVLIGYRSTDSAWQIFNNDGTQAMTVTPTTGVTATDTNFHTLQIVWTAGGSPVITIDGNVQAALNAHVPATTTNLYFCDVVQISSTTARAINLHATFVETQK